MKTFIQFLIALSLLFSTAIAAFAQDSPPPPDHGSVDQMVHYQAGWNMVSFAAQPTDMSLQNIMYPVLYHDHLIKMIDENGNIIEEMPWGWVDNIGDMQPTEGYYLKIAENDSTKLLGAAVEFPYEIPLTAGWNMIGYPSMNSQDASNAFYDLMNNNILIKAIDQYGNIIEQLPWGWVDNIGTLNPGEGYYVKVSEDATLTLYDYGGYYGPSTGTYQAPVAESFQTVFSGNPFQPMQVMVDAEDMGLETGDELAVYGDGYCVAAAGYNPNEPIQFLAAANDDPTTNAIDGYTEGAVVSLKVFDQSEQLFYSVSYDVIEGSDTFQSLGTLLAKATDYHTDNNNLGLGQLALNQNHPNPMKNQAQITYTLPTSGVVKLELFNMQGQLQQILADAPQASGVHEVTVSGNDLQSGIYFYKLTFQSVANQKEKVLIKKLVVID